MRFLGLVLLLALAGGMTPLAAHEAHKGKAPAASSAASPIGGDALPLDIEARFSLLDHRGRQVSEADYRGRYLLVFFGYANCEAMCPLALASLLEAYDLLSAEERTKLQPLLITVDAERDRPEVLAEEVGELHPALIGLTGEAAALAAARQAFRVDARELNPSLLDGKTGFAHGTYIYLMGPDGGLLSLLPPVLAPERMAAIVSGYMAGKGS